MRGLRLLVVVLAGCGPDVLEGFVCADLGPRCPPGASCQREECGVSDCAGICVLPDDNQCSADEECPLSGYGCRDGHCVPVAICDTDADCVTGFCFAGPYHGGVFASPEPGGRTSLAGVCVEPDPDCGPIVVQYSCSGSCRACIWGEWTCVSPELGGPYLQAYCPGPGCACAP